MDAEFFEQMKPRFLSPQEEQKPSPDDPYPNVPSELKALHQWVLWKAEVRNGKQTKIPKQVSGENAKSDTPATWTDYTSGIMALRTGRFSGIGFVFTSEDVYIGIDLDNCIVDGKVQPWAKEIIDKLQPIAYMEVSPSGNGIKIWTRAKLPSKMKHKHYLNIKTGEAIEAYDTGRFFTVTGRGKYAIGDGQAACDWLVKKYLKKDKPAPAPAPVPMKDTLDTSDITQLIESSRQSHKFLALMRGDTTGYGSHSEADLGLVSLLCFWTQDARHLDAIFRQSGLYRSKWDEKHRARDGATYGEMTIEKAIAENRETYTRAKPKKQRKRRHTFYEARARRRRYGKQR